MPKISQGGVTFNVDALSNPVIKEIVVLRDLVVLKETTEIS